MTRTASVKALAELLCKTGATIAHLSETIESESGELYSSLTDMLLNELENIQHTVLCLTQMVADFSSETTNADDGSAFATGELNSNLGDKTDDHDKITIHKEEK